MKKMLTTLILSCVFFFAWASGVGVQAQVSTPIPTPAVTPYRTVSFTLPAHCSVPCQLFYEVTVMDNLGNPIVGASVSTGSGSAVTNSAGYCKLGPYSGSPEFSDCAHGTVRVDVSAAGYVATYLLSGISCPGYSLIFRLNPIGGFSPPPTPAVPVAKFSIDKAAYVVQGKPFSIDLYLTESSIALTAYAIQLLFDPALVKPNTTIGTNGVEVGFAGFLNTAVIATNSLSVTGQSAIGIGPLTTGVTSLRLLKFNFIPLKGGVIEFLPQFTSLTGANNTAMNSAYQSDTPVKILGIGDVNFDQKINIVDALLIAQYQVAASPDSSLYWEAADVNGDNLITIVDALIVAQYSVGLIPQLPIAAYGPQPKLLSLNTL